MTGERLPLQGKRVLLTRARGRADGLAARLRQLGAEPVLRPTIAHAPPADPAALDEALGRLEAGVYEWLLLTSVTAVEVVAEALADRAPALGGRVSLRVGAVGPATAAACRELLGVEPAAVPERFTGADLAGAIGDPVGRRVLLPNAELAAPALEERLRAAGALVDRVVAYRTVPAPGGGGLAATLAAGELDAILFTSGSTARFFAEQVGPAGLEAARRAAIVCIGPSTAETCRELGLEPTAVAATSTEEGLVAALVAHYTRAP
ncbi:MAG TPA: uroporphyrinogen-III synthase [Chloroflexaceae bacterium]|nr:uroporphyrinogen-III synthase [Chloroflexaceae bacterium]